MEKRHGERPSSEMNRNQKLLRDPICQPRKQQWRHLGANLSTNLRSRATKATAASRVTTTPFRCKGRVLQSLPLGRNFRNLFSSTTALGQNTRIYLNLAHFLLMAFTYPVKKLSPKSFYKFIFPSYFMVAPYDNCKYQMPKLRVRYIFMSYMIQELKNDTISLGMDFSHNEI